MTHRPCMISPPRTPHAILLPVLLTDCGAEERHQEEQSEKHAPEGATKYALLPCVVKLTRLRLLVPRLPADQGRVIDGDVTLRLQSIQSLDGCFGVINTGEGRAVSIVIEALRRGSRGRSSRSARPLILTRCARACQCHQAA